jgi:D-3-phosphoglycerate dehydrogenase
MGAARINIATFHLGLDAPGGSAIALIDVDRQVPTRVVNKLQALPQVRQARALVF